MKKCTHVYIIYSKNVIKKRMKKRVRKPLPIYQLRSSLVQRSARLRLSEVKIKNIEENCEK